MNELANKRIAGRFVKQSEGYSAYIPDPLPPNPSLHFDDELRELLSKADRAIGYLDGSVRSLPDPDQFVFMYVRKEAVLSSQIEGTQASLGDILEEEAQIIDNSRPHDVKETLNYVVAMNKGLERLAALPISQRLIREMHSILMRGVRGQHADPGEFRRSQIWVGPPGSTLMTATFVPPPWHELPRLLTEFEKYIHSSDCTPILVRVALIHAQFETIHPFLDGNGRIGRLLITFILCQQEILQKPVLYLSGYLKRHRDTYYKLLQGIHTDGDWEAWLKFFLRGIVEVSEEAALTATKIVRMREEHRALIVDSLGNGAANGLRFLETLYDEPFFDVARVARALEMSSQGAQQLTTKLVQLNLVWEITGKRRNRIFCYQEYVSLFLD